MKIAFIFNLGPHYRFPIYNLIDEYFSSDFYFGNQMKTSIKTLDYFKLKGFKGLLKNRFLGNLYWQSNVVSLFFKPYNIYVITGELYCISTWTILLFNFFLDDKKIYLWSHGYYGNESFLKKKLKKLYFSLADKVLLYGDYAKRLMINEGFDPKKLLSIYNSLDYNNQLEIRNNLRYSSIFEKKFNNFNPTIIYIGRIQKSKKIDLLLNVVDILNRNDFSCNLVLVGEDVDDLISKDLIDSLNLGNNVWLYGPCYDEKHIGELIFNSHVCVSPGNVGLTAIHCFTYGLPVITHNNFSNQGPEFEIINDSITGSYFKEDSIEDLYEKVKFWISRSKDERDIVRHLCYDLIESKYNPYYQIKVLKEILK